MLRVADLMQKDVRTIDEDAMVSEAILMLADGHISGLPVLNAHRQVVGMISTTDILSAEAESDDAAALNKVATHTRVGDIMTPMPKTIGPEADVKLAAQEMLYLDVHRLLVVHESELVGVITQSDIVRAVAGGQI
ncbi:MAG TPA: CBS domain-containing protein [Gemmatimonadales bacterium]|nr:CBS domain-containing protein [Gemmatimonadales bacterium]